MNEIWETMFDAARTVMCERRISEYVSAGAVVALIFLSYINKKTDFKPKNFVRQGVLQNL